jgi:hypothetical protein
VASLVADVSLDGLLLNGCLFQSPVGLSEFATILAMPHRVVDPSPPAPYGHRNNQIHIFDELGLYLIEHHATRLVDAVVFVLWLEESVFKPTCELTAELPVGGVKFFAGMMTRDHRGGTIRFEGPILGLWTARKNGICVGLNGTGMRQANGRRGRRMRFVDVSVCFSSRSLRS